VLSIALAVGAPVATAALVASVLLRRPLLSRATARSIHQYRSGLDSLGRIAAAQRRSRLAR